MPYRILICLTGSLLSILCAGPAMANGYDDAQAGIAALNNGNNAEAIRRLSRALDSGQILNGDRASAYFDRGLAWANSGENDKAIGLNAQDADTYEGRGLAWINVGEYDKAVADFNEAVRLNPKDGVAFHYRGLARLNKDEFGKAVADFNEAIRVNRQDAVAFFYRGLAEFDLGRFDDAATDFAQKLDLAPDGATVILLYLSRARSGVPDPEARLAADSKAIDGAKWPAPVIALLLGKSSASTVFLETANADASVQKVQMCEAYFYTGEWRLLARDSGKARDFFSSAVRLCPTRSWTEITAAAEIRRM